MFVCFFLITLYIKGISPGNYPPLFNNIVCSENHSMLLQCIDARNFDINDCESGTAEVTCEMPNASSENMESISDSMSTSVSIMNTGVIFDVRLHSILY